MEGINSSLGVDGVACRAVKNQTGGYPVVVIGLAIVWCGMAVVAGDRSAALAGVNGVDYRSINAGVAGGAGWVEYQTLFGGSDDVAAGTVGRGVELVVDNCRRCRGGAVCWCAIGAAGMAIFANYRGSGDLSGGDGVDYCTLGAGMAGDANSSMDTVNYIGRIVAGCTVRAGNVGVGGIWVGKG